MRRRIINQPHAPGIFNQMLTSVSSLLFLMAGIFTMHFTGMMVSAARTARSRANLHGSMFGP